MGESAAQSQLIFYLLKVLEWLYRAEGWFAVSNLNIYRERRRNEYPLAPDVAVFKGVVVPNVADRQLRSWRLYEPNRPAPQVVFEISSQETWREDLEHKPAAYAALGASEYYAYEPNDPPYWPQGGGRLRGWWLESGAWPSGLPISAAGSGARSWKAGLCRMARCCACMIAMVACLTEGEAQRAAKEAERAAKEAAWAKLRELGIDPESLK